MCYGSGCSKENYMGDCRVCDYKPYRETKFAHPCVLYGNLNEIINYYLTIEEHELFLNSYEQSEELAVLAQERWANDEERKKVIEEIEEKYPWYKR